MVFLFAVVELVEMLGYIRFCLEKGLELFVYIFLGFLPEVTLVLFSEKLLLFLLNRDYLVYVLLLMVDNFDKLVVIGVILVEFLRLSMPDYCG